MLKYLLSSLLLVSVSLAQPFPPQPGPVIISQPGTGGSSSSSVDTNTVLALIAQYGGGGIVSNAIIQIAAAVPYTNTTPYKLVGIMNYAMSGTATKSSIDVDTNQDGTTDFSFVQSGVSLVLLSNTLPFYVPSGAKWIWNNIGSGSYQQADLDTLNYYGTNSNSGSSGVSSAQVAAIMWTNNGSQNYIRYITKLRPAIGDTNYFGPWTPGTVTSGIQEAWDSIPKGTNQGPIVTGAEFVFDDLFFFTNRLVFSNNHPIYLTLKGVGLLNSGLVYAGPTNVVDTILFKTADSGSGTLSIPWHITIEDMCFSSITNSTNILLHITDYSDLQMNRCNFTSWQMRTNQAEGAGVSTANTSTTGMTAGNQVGLVLDGGGPDHGTTLRDIYFAALATGVYTESDHMSAKNLRFAHIGVLPSIWPATSKYSLGSCIMRKGGLESEWDYLHLYDAKSGFVMLEQGYDSPTVRHANFEGVSHPICNLAANTRAPIVVDPVVFGDSDSWAIAFIRSLTISNSPNYGYVNNNSSYGVIYGTDTTSAQDAGKFWQIDVGGASRFYLEDAAGSVATRMVGTASVVDGDYTIDLNPTAGLIVAPNDFSQAVQILPNGTINASDSITSPVITSENGSGIDMVRPKIGTNSVTTVPNISIYLTNFDGTVYRLSAQRIVP
jgi:hypothetical protein